MYHSEWCAYVLLWAVMVLGGGYVCGKIVLRKEIMKQIKKEKTKFID